MTRPHDPEPTTDTRDMQTADCRHCREPIRRVSGAPRWHWKHESQLPGKAAEETIR